jgi:hypothetical protein
MEKKKNICEKDDRKMKNKMKNKMKIKRTEYMRQSGDRNNDSKDKESENYKKKEKKQKVKICAEKVVEKRN